MKTRVYLVRHGHVHNPKGIWYGRLPGFPLSKTGKRQALALGKKLSTNPVSIIYTSPLTRAYETATHIGFSLKDAAIFHDERLIEVYSPTQGMSWQAMEKINW